MFTCDEKRLGKLACEAIRVSIIHGVANGVIVVDDCLAAMSGNLAMLLEVRGQSMLVGSYTVRVYQ